MKINITSVFSVKRPVRKYVSMAPIMGTHVTYFENLVNLKVISYRKKKTEVIFD